MTFFFRYMPEFIEAGMLYVGCPPLYKLHYGKNITYCMNDKELQKETEKLRSKNIKYSVTRFKGLTETSPEIQQCIGNMHFYTGRTYIC